MFDREVVEGAVCGLVAAALVVSYLLFGAVGLAVAILLVCVACLACVVVKEVRKD